VVAAHGSPVFVYSKAAMLQALSAYQRGMQGRRSSIHYAVKANSSLGILKVFADAGCGFDIVSEGELSRVLHVGADPKRVVFSGVGKTEREMRLALQHGIGCFNVESLPELHALNAVALSMGVQAPVSLRINPNVDAQTHPYISTGLKDNKFGIAHEDAMAAYQLAHSLPGLKVCGIDCHIGSQITQSTPFLDAMDKILDLVVELESAGIALEHIDFGGGLGIDYKGETPPSADALWQALWQRVDARGLGHKLFMTEPGRSLVGNAGLCLTQVIYLKEGEHKNFCIVDAAMNDLPRPAMYQAYHQIVPISPRGDETPKTTWDVVGPVCESGDWLGRDRELACRPGDVLAVLSAGAYSMSMASEYNSRPKLAEVLIDGHEFRCIRQRNTIQDLWHNETP
jgi:diaminopimelate decarboxylase